MVPSSLRLRCRVSVLSGRQVAGRVTARSRDEATPAFNIVFAMMRYALLVRTGRRGGDLRSHRRLWRGFTASDASSGPAASAAVAQDLQQATLIVPDALKGKIDPQQVLIPPGWSMSAWASVPDARLAAWTPDGALLVSRPGEGQVVRLTHRGKRPPRPSCSTGSPSRTGSPSPAPPSTSPRATRSSPTPTRQGAATGPRVVADGLPDAKSPELGGRTRTRSRAWPSARTTRCTSRRVERQHLRRRP